VANATTGATSSTLESSIANATAMLINAGNLVLQAPNGTMLWQSFNHPMDTLLPEMKLSTNYGKRPGDRLVSWRSPSDPSPRSFSYGADPPTFLQTIVWNGSRTIWRNNVWTGYRVTSQYLTNISAIIYITIVDMEDDTYFSFSLSNGASRTRYVMSYAGKMVLQSWNNTSRRWDVIAVTPPTECNQYGHCGPFGYCNNIDSELPTCKC
jgi:hypothetical protein